MSAPRGPFPKNVSTALTEAKSPVAVMSPPAKAMYGFIALNEDKLFSCGQVTAGQANVWVYRTQRRQVVQLGQVTAGQANVWVYRTQRRQVVQLRSSHRRPSQCMGLSHSTKTSRSARSSHRRAKQCMPVSRRGQPRRPKSTASFTSAVLARSDPAFSAAGSVTAAAARHAAHAIAVAEVEIFAHTVVTSLGCGHSTASHLMSLSGRETLPAGKSNLP